MLPPILPQGADIKSRLTIVEGMPGSARSEGVKAVYERLGAVQFWWERRLQADREGDPKLPRPRGRLKAKKGNMETWELETPPALQATHDFLRRYRRDAGLWRHIRRQTRSARYVKTRTTLAHLWLAHLLHERVVPSQIAPRNGSIPGGLTQRQLGPLVKRLAERGSPHVMSLRPAPAPAEEGGSRARMAFVLRGPPPSQQVTAYLDAQSARRFDHGVPANATRMSLVEHAMTYRPEHVPLYVSDVLSFRANVLRWLDPLANRLGADADQVGAVKEVLAEPFWPLWSLFAHVDLDVALTWWEAQERARSILHQTYATDVARPEWRTLWRALATLRKGMLPAGLTPDARALLIMELGVRATRQRDASSARRSVHNALETAWATPRLRPATRAVVACNMALALQWYGRADAALEWSRNAMELAHDSEAKQLEDVAGRTARRVGRGRTLDLPPSFVASQGIPLLADAYREIWWLVA